MSNDLNNKAFDWVLNNAPILVADEYFCETRDIFQARLEKMISELIKDDKISEEYVYIITAIAGEIGNNSFDHNLGNWPDVMGIFFGYNLQGKKLVIVLADRGQGVFNTLKRVKPEIKDDMEALFTAFNERISGRAPEPRGNGLKFVKESVRDKKIHLTFRTGYGQAELNQDIKIFKIKEKIHGCLAVINF